MNGVRVLVGTRKGAFILTSDDNRKKWDVAGPHLGVQARLAPRAVVDRSRYGLRRSGRRCSVQVHGRWTNVGGAPAACAATALDRGGRPAPVAWACTRFFWILEL